MKRLLSITMAVFLVVSTLAGCAKPAKEASAPAQSEKTVTQEEKKTEAAKTEAKSDEVVEVSWAHYNNSEWGKDKIGEVLLNDLKVSIKPVPYSNSDWKDKVKLWASQDELPNVFRTMGVYDADTFFQFINNGIIRDIPEEMLKARPNLWAMLEANPVYKEFKVDGKIYSLPHVYWRTQEEDWKGGVSWIRKDWLNALGLQVPKTLDEWTNMMDAFANKDPDGNGKKDTFGITYFREEIPTFIFSAHGAYIEEWVEEDGKWIHGTYSKHANEAVKYSKMLFDKGILDPEYVVQKEVGQVLDKFVTGKAGTMVYGTMPNEVKLVYEHFEAANPGKKAEDCLEIILYPESIDGTVKNSAAFNWFSDIEFSAKTTDEQLEKILDVFEWSLTEEGDRITRYGFEGEDYKMENGKPVSILPKKADGTQTLIAEKYPTAEIGLYYCQKSTEQFQDAVIEDRYLKVSLAAKELYKGTGLENTINWKAKFMYTPTKSKLNPLAPFRVETNKMIISGKDLDIDAEIAKFWKNFDIEYDAFKAFDELTEAMK